MTLIQTLPAETRHEYHNIHDLRSRGAIREPHRDSAAVEALGAMGTTDDWLPLPLTFAQWDVLDCIYTYGALSAEDCEASLGLPLKDTTRILSTLTIAGLVQPNDESPAHYDITPRAASNLPPRIDEPQSIADLRANRAGFRRREQTFYGSPNAVVPLSLQELCFSGTTMYRATNPAHLDQWRAGIRALARAARIAVRTSVSPYGEIAFAYLRDLG